MVFDLLLVTITEPASLARGRSLFSLDVEQQDYPSRCSVSARRKRPVCVVEYRQFTPLEAGRGRVLFCKVIDFVICISFCKNIVFVLSDRGL